mgnify:CR=1 FL=1
MKEKIYIIFKNNEEEYDDYSDWITEIYKDKERAEKRFVELVKTNQYKKDRTIRKVKYNEDIGAYRIEEHEIENETKRNEVIDTNSDSIEEDIKKQKESLRNWLAMHVLIKENSYMRFNYEDCWNLYKFVENALIKSDDYKRVLKENENLKKYIAIAPNLDEMTAVQYVNIQRDSYIQGRVEEQQKAKQIIYENYIPVQKVKDKIEEYKKMLLSCNRFSDVDRIRAINERILDLQELSEESEDSKNGEG